MSHSAAEHDQPPGKLSWWRRWILAPILTQLRQGTSVPKLSWTIATGVTIGLFPIPGTRGWLCLLAGIGFQLNQPLLHTFKGLFFPLHLALLIPFIRLGEWLFGVEPLPLTREGLEQLMSAGAWSFLRESAGMLLRGAAAWLLTAPAILLSAYGIALPLVRLSASFLKKQKSKSKPA